MSGNFEVGTGIDVEDSWVLSEWLWYAISHAVSINTDL
jgi:hypothetical protein